MKPSSSSHITVPSVRAFGAVLLMFLRPSITSASLRLAHLMRSPRESTSGWKWLCAAFKKCCSPRTLIWWLSLRSDTWSLANQLSASACIDSPFLYTTLKLDQLRYSDHLACHWLKSCAVAHHSIFLWSVTTSKGSGRPSKKCLQSSNARIQPSISVTYAQFLACIGTNS